MARFVAAGFLLLFFVSCVVTTPESRPAPLDCPLGEEYYECSTARCFKTCDDAKANRPCPQIAGDCFEPSCECTSGYLRNNDGVCVPFADC